MPKCLRLPRRGEQVVRPGLVTALPMPALGSALPWPPA